LSQPGLNRGRVERPVQLTVTALVAQHRHPRAIARFQRRLVIQEHRFELRHPGLGQLGQGHVAQVAVVTLEQSQHRMGPLGGNAAPQPWKCGMNR
jgi:hypothetical protein